MKQVSRKWIKVPREISNELEEGLPKAHSTAVAVLINLQCQLEKETEGFDWGSKESERLGFRSLSYGILEETETELGGGCVPIIPLKSFSSHPVKPPHKSFKNGKRKCQGVLKPVYKKRTKPIFIYST